MYAFEKNNNFKKILAKNDLNFHMKNIRIRKERNNHAPDTFKLTENKLLIQQRKSDQI